MNYCKFVANIEKDPTAIINDLTIRDYLGLRNHVASCTKCQESMDRVLANEPPDHIPPINLN